MSLEMNKIHYENNIETMKIDLRHGDCLEIMPTIPDGSVDMILCDLPYGTTACKWDVVIPFEPLWKEYKRIIKKNGAIVLFGSEPFSSHLRLSNLKWYKYDWVWEKEQGVGFQLSAVRPLIKNECVSIFCDGRLFYYPQKRLLDSPRIIKRKIGSNGKSETSPLSKSSERVSIYTHKTPDNFLRFSRDKGFHSTQKPVALLEYLIKTYTLDGETVMDNTMGSGSTGVACKNLNRNFIGIEKDDKYFEIAQKRIHGTMPQQKLAI